MTTETVPGRVNVGEFSGKEFLLNLDRSERAEFYKLLDEAPWEGKTASGHWQVRDVCGHLIDVTEGYLDRFALARAAGAADHGAEARRRRAAVPLPFQSRCHRALKSLVGQDVRDLRCARRAELVRRDCQSHLYGSAAGLFLCRLPV